MNTSLTQTLIKQIRDQTELKRHQSHDGALDLEHFQRLHRAGADVQEAFGALCEPGFFSYSDARRAKTAAWLIAAGANPLLYPRFEIEMVAAVGQEFFRQCLQALAERDASDTPCRRAGENVLHLLYSTANPFRLALDSLPNHADVLRTWLREPRPQDQATPTHLLWRHQSIGLVHAAASGSNDDLRNYSSIMSGSLQAITIGALRRGADYSAEDGTGLTVFNLIRQTNSQGLGSLPAPPWGNWDHMLALLEQYQLNRDTAPTTPQESSRPPRL